MLALLRREHSTVSPASATNGARANGLISQCCLPAQLGGGGGAAARVKPKIEGLDEAESS